MKLSEVYDNLCVRDRRSPSFNDFYWDEDEEAIPEPRQQCFCDNCFYGKDRLALEIIRLMEKSDD